MKSDLPWQIGGLRQQALEAAREAAHRRGVAVGEWLDGVILDSALQQQVVQPRPSGRPQSDPRAKDADDDLRAPGCRDPAADKLRDEIAAIGLMLRKALPPRAALENEVRRLADRLDSTRHASHDDPALARIERGLADMRAALRSPLPVEALRGVAQALHHLSQRIDRIGGSVQDAVTVRQLDGAIAAMRDLLAHLASSNAPAKLSEDLRSLAERMVRLEELLAKLAEKLDASDARRDHLEAIEHGLARLHLECQRISKLAPAPASPPMAEIDVLSRDIADLRQSEKQTRDSLQMVDRTLGRLVDRLTMTETDIGRKSGPPETAAVAADAPCSPAAAPIGPSRGTTDHPVGPASEEAPADATAPTSKPAAQPATEHDSIGPSLAVDHPLEPGFGAAGGRSPGQPLDRSFGSEAAFDAVRPSTSPDCGGKSDFIAAARRAVQAAGQQVIEKNRASPPPELAPADARPGGRIGKVGTLIGVMTGVLAVLGGLQVARFLRNSSDEAKATALGRTVVAASPAAPAAADTGPSPAHPSAPIRRQAGGAHAIDGTAIATDGAPSHQRPPDASRR